MSPAPFYDDGTVTIWCADVRDVPLSELAATAACVVTSPPYNVGLAYDGDPAGDALAWDAYWRLADAAAVVMGRALVPGGRVWVNTAVSVPETPAPGGPHSGGIGKRRVLLARGWADALELGGRLVLVDQVSWQSIRAGGCAWGSWQSPAAPNLRGDHELITVACRDGWERRAPVGLEGWQDTIGDWPGLCSTVWTVPTIGGRIPAGANTPGGVAGHPAAMPVEVARRCIRLSTWPGEVVFDPFAGSGTTLLAARQLGRRAIGVERSARYCELAVARLAQTTLDFEGAA
jgi:site-specific DNA-methyltransferase (adenine-specific)